MQGQPNIRVDVQSLVLLNLGCYRQYFHLKTEKSSWPIYRPPHVCNYSGGLLVFGSKGLLLVFSHLFSY